MKFDWDETKNALNIEKHGINFKEAQTVFYDEHWIKVIDDGHTDGDATDTIRIFSARVAKKHEKEVYNAYI